MGTRQNRLNEAVLTCTYNICFEQKYENSQTISTENCYFYSSEKSLYIAWACFCHGSIPAIIEMFCRIDLEALGRFELLAWKFTCILYFEMHIYYNVSKIKINTAFFYYNMFRICLPYSNSKQIHYIKRK